MQDKERKERERKSRKSKERQEYPVERVLDMRTYDTSGKVEYLIKWAGYDEQSWEFAEDCKNCPEKVASYSAARSKRQAVPRAQSEEVEGGVSAGTLSDSPATSCTPVNSPVSTLRTTCVLSAADEVAERIDPAHSTPPLRRSTRSRRRSKKSREAEEADEAKEHEKDEEAKEEEEEEEAGKEDQGLVAGHLQPLEYRQFELWDYIDSEGRWRGPVEGAALRKVAEIGYMPREARGALHRGQARVGTARHGVPQNPNVLLASATRTRRRRRRGRRGRNRRTGGGRRRGQRR
jgi:hypothetical protein